MERERRVAGTNNLPMTTSLPNQVSTRFHAILMQHMDATVADYDLDGTHLADFLEGKTCSVVFRHGDTLVMVYVPRHRAQFIFDAYG